MTDTLTATGSFTDPLAVLRESNRPNLHGSCVQQIVLGWDLILTVSEWRTVKNTPYVLGRSVELFDSDWNHIMTAALLSSRDDVAAAIATVSEQVKSWKWAEAFINPNPKIHDGTDPTHCWSGLEAQR